MSDFKTEFMFLTYQEFTRRDKALKSIRKEIELTMKTDSRLNNPDRSSYNRWKKFKKLNPILYENLKVAQNNLNFSRINRIVFAELIYKEIGDRKKENNQS